MEVWFFRGEQRDRGNVSPDKFALQETELFTLKLCQAFVKRRATGISSLLSLPRVRGPNASVSLFASEQQREKETNGKE